MIVNNDLKELIFIYINRYYRYENDFYKKSKIKLTDANWQRFKNGETSIEKMGAARVNAMLSDLFSDFELALIGQAQTKYYFSWSLKSSMTFSSYYDLFKKEMLIKWIEDCPEDIIAGLERLYTSSGSQTTNYLDICLESSALGDGCYMQQLRFKSMSSEQIPAGRENRLKWIKQNLENIR